MKLYYCYLHTVQQSLLVLNDVARYVEQPFKPLPDLQHSVLQKIPWDYFSSPWRLLTFPFEGGTNAHKEGDVSLLRSLWAHEWEVILSCIIIGLNRAQALLGTILERGGTSL